MSSPSTKPLPSSRRHRADRFLMTPQDRLGAVVVGAPAALALAVLVHPHETDDAIASLQIVDDHRVRWVLAHLLESFAWLAVAAVLFLAGGIAARRSTGFVRLGGTLAALGAAAMSLIVYGHGEAFRYMSEEPSEYVELTRLYGRFHNGMPLAGAVAPAFHLGVLLLGVGLIRSGAVPRWVGAALVIVPILLVTAGPSLSPPWAAVAIGIPLVIGFAGLRAAIVMRYRPTTPDRVTR